MAYSVWQQQRWWKFDFEFGLLLCIVFNIPVDFRKWQVKFIGYCVRWCFHCVRAHSMDTITMDNFMDQLRTNGPLMLMLIMMMMTTNEICKKFKMFQSILFSICYIMTIRYDYEMFDRLHKYEIEIGKWGNWSEKLLSVFESYSIFNDYKWTVICMINWLTNFMHNTEIWFTHILLTLNTWSAHYMWLSLVRIRMSERAMRIKKNAKHTLNIWNLIHFSSLLFCVTYKTSSSISD